MDLKFLDLLSGKAFRPDVLDLTVPLARRFLGQKFAGVSGALGSDVEKSSPVYLKLALVEVSKKGEIKISPMEYVETRGFNAQVSVLRDFATVHGCGHAGVLLSDSVSASLTDKVPAGLDDLSLFVTLRDSPGKALGMNVDTSRHYAVLRHPKLNTSLAFSLEKRVVAGALKVVTSAMLQPVRVQCGFASLMGFVLDKYPDVFSKGDVLLVSDTGVFYLPAAPAADGVLGDWKRPSFKSGACFRDDLLDFVRSSLGVPGRGVGKLSVINVSRVDLSPVFSEFKDLEPVVFQPAGCSARISDESGSREVSFLDFKGLCHN